MARSRTSKFNAPEAITNELIRIIERGVLPWRKPWTAGGSTRPLRHNNEPYQGVNNFLLTMRGDGRIHLAVLDDRATCKFTRCQNPQRREVVRRCLLWAEQVAER